MQIILAKFYKIVKYVYNFTADFIKKKNYSAERFKSQNCCKLTNKRIHPPPKSGEERISVFIFINI